MFISVLFSLVIISFTINYHFLISNLILFSNACIMYNIPQLMYTYIIMVHAFTYNRYVKSTDHNKLINY